MSAMKTVEDFDLMEASNDAFDVADGINLSSMGQTTHEGISYDGYENSSFLDESTLDASNISKHSSRTSKRRVQKHTAVVLNADRLKQMEESDNCFPTAVPLPAAMINHNTTDDLETRTIKETNKNSIRSIQKVLRSPVKGQSTPTNPFASPERCINPPGNSDRSLSTPSPQIVLTSPPHQNVKLAPQAMQNRRKKQSSLLTTAQAVQRIIHWYRTRRHSRYQKYTQDGQWSLSTAQKVHALLIGHQIRTIFKKNQEFRKLISAQRDVKQVISDLDNDLHSDSETMLLQGLRKELLTAREKLSSYLWKASVWSAYPPPGYWQITIPRSVLIESSGSSGGNGGNSSGKRTSLVRSRSVDGTAATAGSNSSHHQPGSGKGGGSMTPGRNKIHHHPHTSTQQEEGDDRIGPRRQSLIQETPPHLKQAMNNAVNNNHANTNNIRLFPNTNTNAAVAMNHRSLQDAKQRLMASEESNDSQPQQQQQQQSSTANTSLNRSVKRRSSFRMSTATSSALSTHTIGPQYPPRKRSQPDGGGGAGAGASIQLHILSGEKLMPAKKGALSLPDGAISAGQGQEVDRKPSLKVSMFLPGGQGGSAAGGGAGTATTPSSSSHSMKRVYHVSREYDIATYYPKWDAAFSLPLPFPKQYLKSLIETKHSSIPSRFTCSHHHHEEGDDGEKTEEGEGEVQLTEAEYASLVRYLVNYYCTPPPPTLAAGPQQQTMTTGGYIDIEVFDNDRFHEDIYLGHVTLLMTSFLPLIKKYDAYEMKGVFTLEKVAIGQRVSGSITLIAYLHVWEKKLVEEMMSEVRMQLLHQQSSPPVQVAAIHVNSNHNSSNSHNSNSMKRANSVGRFINNHNHNNHHNNHHADNNNNHHHTANNHTTGSNSSSSSHHSSGSSSHATASRSLSRSHLHSSNHQPHHDEQQQQQQQGNSSNSSKQLRPRTTSSLLYNNHNHHNNHNNNNQHHQLHKLLTTSDMTTTADNSHNAAEPMFLSKFMQDLSQLRINNNSSSSGSQHQHHQQTQQPTAKQHSELAAAAEDDNDEDDYGQEEPWVTLEDTETLLASKKQQQQQQPSQQKSASRLSSRSSAGSNNRRMSLSKSEVYHLVRQLPHANNQNSTTTASPSSAQFQQPTVTHTPARFASSAAADSASVGYSRPSSSSAPGSATTPNSSVVRISTIISPEMITSSETNKRRFLQKMNRYFLEELPLVQERAALVVDNYQRKVDDTRRQSLNLKQSVVMNIMQDMDDKEGVEENDGDDDDQQVVRMQDIYEQAEEVAGVVVEEVDDLYYLQTQLNQNKYKGQHQQQQLAPAEEAEELEDEEEEEAWYDPGDEVEDASQELGEIEDEDEDRPVMQEKEEEEDEEDEEEGGRVDEEEEEEEDVTSLPSPFLPPPVALPLPLPLLPTLPTGSSSNSKVYHANNMNNSFYDDDEDGVDPDAEEEEEDNLEGIQVIHVAKKLVAAKIISSSDKTKAGAALITKHSSSSSSGNSSQQEQQQQQQSRYSTRASAIKATTDAVAKATASIVPMVLLLPGHHHQQQHPSQGADGLLGQGDSILVAAGTGSGSGMLTRRRSLRIPSTASAPSSALTAADEIPAFNQEEDDKTQGNKVQKPGVAGFKTKVAQRMQERLQHQMLMSNASSTNSSYTSNGHNNNQEESNIAATKNHSNNGVRQQATSATGSRMKSNSIKSSKVMTLNLDDFDDDDA